jgi:phosphoserine phosphatase
MTLYIIRHGETDMNRQGIVQGSGVDSELNDNGRKQAHLFYQYYKNLHFEYIITSNLKRTHQTVEPFLLSKGLLSERGLQHEWVKLPELNEISWGIHEGKKGSNEQHQSYKNLMSDWESGVYDSKIEGGESAAQLHTRVTKAVDFFKSEQHAKKNILVCTHGRTLLCLLSVLKNLPLSKMNTFKHQNTCLYKVHHIDNEFLFELENDVQHLGGNKTVDF